MSTDIFAAIDIGSNAIRLLINNIKGYKSGQDYKKLAYLRVPIRLGEDVFTEGIISDEKKHRLIEAMQGFHHLINAYNVKSYKACATSAMRDASNGKEIEQLIREKTGINIQIISGDEEAEIIYKAGGLNELLDKNKNYLYVDVGGGSTEIVLYSKQQKITAKSFQMGTVRALVSAVSETEEKLFKQQLKKISKQYSPLSIIASGGNINKVYKILGNRENEVSYTEMKVLYDTLKDMSYEERMLAFKLNPYRADVIIPALKIFLTVAKVCKINTIHVPKVGLVDGIIHQLYDSTK